MKKKESEKSYQAKLYDWVIVPMFSAIFLIRQKDNREKFVQEQREKFVQVMNKMNDHFFVKFITNEKLKEISDNLRGHTICQEKINTEVTFGPQIGFKDKSISEEDLKTFYGKVLKPESRESKKDFLHQTIKEVRDKVFDYFHTKNEVYSHTKLNTEYYNLRSITEAWHTDPDFESTNSNQIGFTLSLELLGGKSTIFPYGENINREDFLGTYKIGDGSIHQAKEGEAAIFLTRGKNIDGAVHSVPMIHNYEFKPDDKSDWPEWVRANRPIDEWEFSGQHQRLALILRTHINVERVLTPKFLEWVKNIENNQASSELPNLNSNIFSERLSALDEAAGFSAGVMLARPGFSCVSAYLSDQHNKKYGETLEQCLQNKYSTDNLIENLINHSVQNIVMIATPILLSYFGTPAAISTNYDFLGALTSPIQSPFVKGIVSSAIIEALPLLGEVTMDFLFFSTSSSDEL